MNQNVNQNQMVDDYMVEMARDLLDADLISQFGGHDKSIIVESELRSSSPTYRFGKMNHHCL